MTPTVTWVAAYLWNNLELCGTMKRDGDNRVLQGLLHAAVLRYTSVLHVLRTESSIFPDRVIEEDPSMVEARGCAEALLCECAISRLWLQLRLGLDSRQEDDEEEALEDLCGKMGAARVSATLALTHAMFLGKSSMRASHKVWLTHSTKCAPGLNIVKMMLTAHTTMQC